MEGLKEKLPIMIMIIIAIAICGVTYYFITSETIYYTQIDNMQIKRLSDTIENNYEKDEILE